MQRHYRAEAVSLFENLGGHVAGEGVPDWNIQQLRDWLEGIQAD